MTDSAATTRKWRTFRADTVDLACEDAAKFFGVAPDELVYDVLLKERRGLLGFGRRPGVIEATVKSIPVEEPIAAESDGSTAGSVAIVDGRLVFTPSTGNGRFPTITPGPGIRLLLNGKESPRSPGSVISADFSMRLLRLFRSWSR